MNFKITTLSVLMVSSLITGCLGETSDAKIEQVIEKTLNDKPEIIIRALENYKKKEEAKYLEKQKASLEKASDVIAKDDYSLVLGNPEGDITIVAFKDYRCGYCKKVWPTIQELIEKDKNVKVIFKEFPVLGPESELASRLALASSLQGKDKYREFNAALMGHQGPWDMDTLKEIAKSKGIDVAKIEKDAGDKFVSDAIMKNMQLGGDIGVQGTPAFLVGKTFIPGAVDLPHLEDVIKKEREAKNAPADAPKSE